MSDLPTVRTHVLIVEDHAALRDVIRAYLGSDEFHVCVAASGSEAVEDLPPHHPDVAVVDLSLPDMGGIELIERLRRWSPAMGIVCFSGSGDRRPEALTAGADEFVLKGSSVSALVDAIRRCRSAGPGPRGATVA